MRRFEPDRNPLPLLKPLGKLKAGHFLSAPLSLAKILDYGVAATSAAFPKLLDLDDGSDAAYFYAQGGGESFIAGISDYNDNSGSTRELRSTRRAPKAA